MSDLTNCLDEILTDENGNKIDPVCGVEKLLELLVAETENQDNFTIDNTVIGKNISIKNSTDNKINSLTIYGKARQNTTSGKNLLKNDAVTYTTNGITFTVKDGVITANGTATENATLIIHRIIEKGQVVDDTLLEKTVILSGCPLGGSSSTYKLQFFHYESGKIGSDFGSGSEVITIRNTGQEYCNIAVIVYKGVTVNDAVFKPMIRLASIEDDTYEPYTGGIPSPNPDYPQSIEVSGESYNLLENTATSQTINGVEFVVNEDGSISVNGTATSNAYFVIVRELLLKSGKYILSGCPIGGTSNNYQLYSDVLSISDKGSGVQFELSNETTIDVKIAIYSGNKVDNLTFYPMIRKASVKNDRYMPYGKGSVEVKSVGKNLLENTATSQTINGVTFTVNEDKSVTANGTATAEIDYPINQTTVFENGTYILNGCPSGGSGGTYCLRCTRGFDSTKNETGTGVSFTKTSGEDSLYLKIQIISGTTVNNLVFKPMIRLASDTDSSYEPYKETLSTIPTPNGLAGIPVDSGGNYTDSNGQQWICDEIVKYADGSGERIQRVGKTVLNGSEGIAWTVNDDGIRVVVYCNPNALWDKHDASKKYDTNILCNCLIGDLISSGINRVYFDNNWLNMSFDSGYFTSSDEFNAWLTNNNLEFWYELAEPIRTPLTAEEIAEIEKLSTFYPVTNIFSEAYCKINYIYNNSLSSQTPLSIVSREIKNTDNLITVLRKIIDRLDDSKIITKVLPVGSTEITLKDSRIDDNSILSIYTSDYGVNPKEIIVSTGSVTLRFNSQEEDLTVGIKIEN